MKFSIPINELILSKSSEGRNLREAFSTIFIKTIVKIQIHLSIIILVYVRQIQNQHTPKVVTQYFANIRMYESTYFFLNDNSVPLIVNSYYKRDKNYFFIQLIKRTRLILRKPILIQGFYK